MPTRNIIFKFRLQGSCLTFLNGNKKLAVSDITASLLIFLRSELNHVGGENLCAS